VFKRHRRKSQIKRSEANVSCIRSSHPLLNSKTAKTLACHNPVTPGVRGHERACAQPSEAREQWPARNLQEQQDERTKLLTSSISKYLPRPSQARSSSKPRFLNASSTSTKQLRTAVEPATASKRKWSAIGYRTSASINVGASTGLIWMPG
jgi:hypothetical protein